VNCRSAQQLISPYLDQQLTGAQMLAMRQHLNHCPACAEEHRQVCEVRRLLRSLSAVAPDMPLELRITQRVSQRSVSGWKFAHSAALLGDMPEGVWRPQRGRRLAGALALSCLALLMLAVPFAPPTGDAARTSGQAEAGVMEAGLVRDTMPMPFPASSRIFWSPGHGRPLFGAPSDLPSAWSGPREDGGTISQAGASVTLSGWSAEPLDDEAVGGYAAGDAALADTAGR